MKEVWLGGLRNWGHRPVYIVESAEAVTEFGSESLPNIMVPLPIWCDTGMAQGSQLLLLLNGGAVQRRYLRVCGRQTITWPMILSQDRLDQTRPTQ